MKGLNVEQVRDNLESGGSMQNDIVSLMDGTCATGDCSVRLWLYWYREEEKPELEPRSICALWPCQALEEGECFLPQTQLLSSKALLPCPT